MRLDGAGFVIVLTALAGTAGAQDRFLDGVLRPADVTVRPMVVVKRLPPYLRPGLTGPEGQLRVEFIVEMDGFVRQARVLRPLGPGGELERETLAVVKEWTFRPAQKDGTAVRMAATMIVTLRRGPGRGATAVYGDATVEGVDDEFARDVPMTAPGLTPARVVKQINPEYPKGVLREKLNGWVQLEAVITPEGVIGEIRIIQTSDSRFDQASLDAVRQWTLQAATKDGKPTASRVIFEIEFHAR